MPVFYLIPFETDKTKWVGDGCAPKYLDILAASKLKHQGLIPKETTVDRRKRKWLRDFYVVKVAGRVPALELKSDVIRIRPAIKTRLQAVGVDMTGAITTKQIGRKICEWLLARNDFDLDKI